MMEVKNDEKKVTKRPGSVIKRDGYRMPFASYKLKYISAPSVWKTKAMN